MKKVKYFLLLLLFFTGYINSISQVRDTNKDFRLEIPTYKNGEKDLFYSLTTQKTSQLELDNLEKGYDSLQIRIWYNYSLSNSKDLIIIKYNHSKWWGYHYKYLVEWDPSLLTETVTKFNIEYIFPIRNWETFIEELLKKKITTLPDMKDVKGLVDHWTDGVTYCVEIGTEHYYRFYRYHLPEMHPNYWQTKNMAEVLNLIKTEFSLTLKQ